MLPPRVGELADLLFGSAGVTAVVLGGSRALDVHDPSSDWDVGVYYRGALDWRPLEQLGVVHPPGSWGRVMNGGAWLQLGDSKVDVLFRDLDFVTRCSSRARDGDYDVDALLGYVAGVPTYSLMAELATCVVLRGAIERPGGFPDQLAERAPLRWRYQRDFSLTYARALARRADVVPAIGQVARAILEEAHARVCAARRWVLNEKRLVAHAGLTSATDWILHPPRRASELEPWIDEAAALLASRTADSPASDG